MGIDRLYYFTVGALAVAFCCVSHYTNWPEQGYKPQDNLGNKWLKEKKKKEKSERAKARQDGRCDARTESRRRDERPQHERRGSSHRERTRQPITSVNEEQPARARSTEPNRTPKRRVSFDDEQPARVVKPTGDKPAVSAPYSYGAGPVRSNLSVSTIPAGHAGRSESRAGARSRSRWRKGASVSSPTATRPANLDE